jgi:hypothetical protein
MPKKRQTLISAREAALLLNEDPRTVQRKAKSGEYASTKLSGLRGSYVFILEDIETIRARRTTDLGRAA